MNTTEYISYRRIVRKRIQKHTIVLKKYIHLYWSVAIGSIGVFLLFMFFLWLYRYFFQSWARRLYNFVLDTKSSQCYSWNVFDIQLKDSLKWSNIWKIKLWFYPEKLTILQKKYPFVWDIWIDRNESESIIWYKCMPPTLIRKIENRIVGSRSGIFVPLSTQTPFINQSLVWYLPNYVKTESLDSIYHTIWEFVIKTHMIQIQSLFQPIRQMYLIGTDKIEIFTKDNKTITLSFSSSLQQQYNAIQRLQKHYFEYRNLTHIDCSNLHHIVVKKS
jgi:hypothetical protein